MPGVMTVEAKGMRFHAKHGLYPEELQTGNEFEVDVIVSFNPEREINDVAQTINYAEVFSMVQEQMQQREDLLETCAMLLSDKLHQKFSFIKTATVNIRKAVPPIPGFNGSVGVSFTQHF